MEWLKPKQTTAQGPFVNYVMLIKRHWRQSIRKYCEPFHFRLTALSPLFIVSLCDSASTPKPSKVASKNKQSMITCDADWYWISTRIWKMLNIFAWVTLSLKEKESLCIRKSNEEASEDIKLQPTHCSPSSGGNLREVSFVSFSTISFHIRPRSRKSLNFVFCLRKSDESVVLQKAPERSWQ